MTRLISRQALVLALASAAAVSPVSAGKPRLSVNVKNGEFSGLEGLDPTVQWSTDGTLGDGALDYSIGGDLAIRPSDIGGGDVSSLPRSVFGKISRTFGGWGLSARADVDLGAPSGVDSADLDVRAENDEIDLALRVAGSAGKALESCSVKKVEIKKGGLNLFGSTVAVTPRFDVTSRKGDVVLSCRAGSSTGVDVVASLDEQKFTLSQKILDNNIIIPSFSTSGDFALQMKRNLSDDRSISATVRPNDSVSVQWTDGAWVADFDAPMEGINLDSINIKIRRKIDIY